MRVQILMSTYNGENFLRAQIDSILYQKHDKFQLLIRDDGSTDQTLSLLSFYKKQDARISYWSGKNLGVVRSFFELIKKADESYDWFAFSDQDDVWMDCKISRALEMMSEYDSSVPLLYCSNKMIADDQLIPVNQQVKEFVRLPSFGNALVQNICTGCTCLFNRKLLQILQRHIPEYAIMHDWWLYLTASCFGTVVYDRNSYIFYRQHNHNVWGTKKSYFDLLTYRIEQLFCKRGFIYMQARSFRACFCLEKENKRLLELLIQSQSSLWKRFVITIDPQFYRQKRSDSIIFRLIQLFGKL